MLPFSDLRHVIMPLTLWSWLFFPRKKSQTSEENIFHFFAPNLPVSTCSFFPQSLCQWKSCVSLALGSLPFITCTLKFIPFYLCNEPGSNHYHFHPHHILQLHCFTELVLKHLNISHIHMYIFFYASSPKPPFLTFLKKIV